MAKEVVFKYSIDGNAQAEARNLAQLEEAIEGLKDSLKGADFGSKEFQRLSGELQAAQSEVKALEKTFEGLEPQQKAEAFLKMGEGIAGGFAAAQGAMALLGEENAEIEEAIVKTQAAISIAMGARMISEGLLQASVAKTIVLQKVATINTALEAKAQTGNTVTKIAATVAQRALNAAVSAFPVLLILGALVAVAAALGAFSDRVAGVVDVTGTLEDQMKSLREEQEDLANQMELLEEYAKKDKTAFDELGEFLLGDLIPTLEETKDLVAQNAIAMEQLEAVMASERRIETLGKQVELLNAQGASVEDIRHAEDKVTKEKLRQNELEIERLKTQLQLQWGTENQIEIENRLTQAIQDRKLLADDIAITNAKRQAADDKAQEEREKRAAEAAAKRREEIEAARRELEDVENNLIESQTERELAQLQTAQERKLKAIKGNSQAENDLRAALERQYQKDVERIQKEGEDRRREQQEEQRKAANEKLAEILAKALEAEKAAYDDRIALAEAERIRAEIKGEETYQREREIEMLRFEQSMLDRELTDAQREQAKAEHEQRLSEIEAKERANRLAAEQAANDARISIAASTTATLQNLAEIAAGNAEKQNNFQKALALISIGVDAAAATIAAYRTAFADPTQTTVLQKIASALSMAAIISGAAKNAVQQVKSASAGAGAAGGAAAPSGLSAGGPTALGITNPTNTIQRPQQQTDSSGNPQAQPQVQQGDTVVTVEDFNKVANRVKIAESRATI